MASQPDQSHDLALELQDGYVCFGNSFGADKSISGELVFQTGMVGYPESITDPSYRGQILVITFPLVGNYGVPSREEMDALLEGVPAHFESSEIHIAGLVVATYAGEEYSHHLATSSLGAWLKEQGVPAITGVDTQTLADDEVDWRSSFEQIEWLDPNKKNLVAEGMQNPNSSRDPS